MWTLDRSDFDAFVDVLGGDGRTVIGPVERDGVVRLGPIHTAEDLPAGRTDRQEPAQYRLVDRDDGALFAYAVGPDSWKRWLFPPELRQWVGTRAADGSMRIESDPLPAEPLVFLGVRPCELRAISILDRVLRDGPWSDDVYARARARAFVVAVECAHPAGTCFCASTGTGPGIDEGFDLALTEIVDAAGHRFVVRAGSARGEDLARRLHVRETSRADRGAATALVAAALERTAGRIRLEGLRELLDERAEAPHWTRVAERCLSCGNCTSVCPTCFCHDVTERTSLDGRRTERVRTWDSCFRPGHSYVHGGTIHASTASRYRQWLTHKLGTWVDQFGVPGCVGCGRCITWCPVGIDLTEEVRALADRATGSGARAGRTGRWSAPWSPR